MTVSGLPTPRERVLAGKSSLISLLSLCLSVLGPLILVSCGLQGLARNTSSPGKNAVRIEDFPLWLHLIYENVVTLYTSIFTFDSEVSISHPGSGVIV